MDNNTSNKTSVKVSVPFERRPASRDDRNFKKEYNLKNRAYRVGAIEEYHKYIIARDNYHLFVNDKDKMPTSESPKKEWVLWAKERIRFSKEFRDSEYICLETVESREDELKLTNSLYNEDYPKPPFSAVADYYWGRVSGKVKLRYTTFKNDLQGKEVLKAGKYMLVTVIVVSAFLCAYLGGGWCLEKINAYFVKEGFECTVKGTVTNNFENKDKIYFGFLDSKNPLDTLTIDSARIINGKFEFKVQSYYATRAYISTDLRSVYLNFADKTALIYIEPRSTVECVIDLKNPYYDTKVYNSPTNDDLIYFTKTLDSFNKRRNALYLKIDSVNRIGDTVQVSILEQQLRVFNIEYSSEYLKTLLSLDSKSAVAFDGYVFLLLNNEYITKQQLGEINKHFEDVSWYIKDCKSGQRVKEMIEYRKKYWNSTYGEIPNIIGRDIKGDSIAISSLSGKYETLLYVYTTKDKDYIGDFYLLQRLYNSYPKGRLKIITFCKDGDVDQWQEDIIRHGNIEWVQLYNNKPNHHNLYPLSLYNRWNEEWNKWNDCNNNSIEEATKYIQWGDKMHIIK